MAEKDLEPQTLSQRGPQSSNSGRNRFDPVKIKRDRSSTKRIALFIFIAAGALFTLVTAAILNSGDDIMSSDTPDEVIEASKSASLFIPPPPRQAEPPEPARAPTPVEEPEPEALEQAPTQPQIARSVRPAYVPAPGGNRARNVTDQKRQAQAQRLQAASSPTAIQGFGRQAASGVDSSALLSDAAGASQADGGAPIPLQGLADGGTDVAGLVGDVTAGTTADPNGWGRKDSFRQQALPAEYSQHTRVFPVSALELKAGSLLPCVLLSGLNTDLPGNLIAQVSENVWDTATGRFLLIPRGSRLIGTYDNQITYGQSRALVIWSRLIFPDGSSLLLDNLQGADQAGYTGFKGKVDRHWGTMIGSALLVSLLGAGVELAAPNNNNSNNNNNNKNVGNILSERVATAIAEAMTQIITKGMNRQPTITVKPGYRFTIFVQHDIVFPRTWSVSQGR